MEAGERTIRQGCRGNRVCATVAELDCLTKGEITPMRTAILVAFLMLVPALARAEPPEKFYYLGEVKLSSATGQPMGSSVMLFEKIHDRDKATVIERGIIVFAEGKVEEQTMYLKVKDDNTFTLSDDAKTVEGSGKFFGPPWQWTYFKGTFKTNKGIVIEDENFLSDPSIGSARKKVSGPDGKVIMYMDISAKAITPRTFEILRANLLRK